MSKKLLRCSAPCAHSQMVLLLSVLLLVSLTVLLFFRGGCLSLENFLDGDTAPTVPKEKLTLFVFLMDGCGWCDKFKPELGVLTGRLSQDSALAQWLDLKIVKFPSSTPGDKQLMRDFSVEGFPSLVLSTNDQSKFWMYHGSSDRTAEKIVQWAQNIGASVA